MPTNKIRVLSSLGLLLAAVIWGFAFVVVKNSLDLIPPIYMLAFRFTIAAAALTLIMLPKLRHLTRRDWISGAVLGIFLFTAHAAQTIGCQYTTAGKNAFLTNLPSSFLDGIFCILGSKLDNLPVLVKACLYIV